MNERNLFDDPVEPTVPVAPSTPVPSDNMFDEGDPVSPTPAVDISTYDFDWGKMISNFPKDVGNIWKDTGKFFTSWEGVRGLGRFGKEVGTIALSARNPEYLARLMLSGELEITRQLFKHYTDNYNITTGAGRARFKKYVEEHPAEFLSDIISLATGVSGKALNAHKYLKYFVKPGKGVQILVDPGAALDVLPLPTGKNSGFNERTAMQAEKFLGEGQGTSAGDVPSMVLSDSKDVQIREGIQMHTEGEVGRRTIERFDKSKAGIDNYQDSIVNKYDVTPGYDPFDIEDAGDILTDNFESTLAGKRGKIGELFSNLETLPDPDMPTQMLYDRINRSYFESSDAFSNARAKLAELRRNDNKNIRNADFQKVENILEFIEEETKGAGSIRDMDNIRTNFRQQMNLAMRNGEITPVGSGTMSSPMYAALTEDLYNMIDTVVREVDPTGDLGYAEIFTRDFRRAKDEYRKLMELQDTAAGAFLFKNQGKGRALIDGILTGDTFNNPKNLDDLKKLVGDQGWTDLEPALLARVFTRSLRQGEWSPTGLRSVVSKINSSREARLSDIFGSTLANDLKELAEFSAKFQREGRVRTNSPTGFINAIIGNSTMSSILVRSGEILGVRIYDGRWYRCC